MYKSPQEITHDSTYTTETMLEIYDIQELPKGTLPLSLNIIDRYQRVDPFLTEKLKSAKYKQDSFRRGRNTIEFVTYNGKILIPQKHQKKSIEMVPHVSPSSRTGKNANNDQPTFVMSSHYRRCPEGSHEL